MPACPCVLVPQLISTENCVSAFVLPIMATPQNDNGGQSSSTSSSESSSYRPEMSEDTVRTLVRDLYGLHVLSCRELDSYDDRNFHVRVEAGRPEAVRNAHLGEVWPHGYVLKVLNSLDSRRPEVIEAKTAMTLAAAEQGFPSPRPVPAVSGQLHVLQPLVRERSDTAEKSTRTEQETEEKEVFLIRLMEFLPGTILASVTLTPDLSFQVGQYAARLDHVLQDVDDSKFPELVVNWNMQNVPSLRNLTCYLDDAKMSSVVTEIIDAFETKVLNCQGGLRKALIHSDFNDHNILVEPVDNPADHQSTDQSTPPSPAMRVCGILDYGDSTKSWLLIEIAIAMAYLILLCPSDLDPDEMAGHALAGYLSELPLTKAELELIPLTICARFSHTLTFGYQRRVQDADNVYCMVHAQRVWSHLERLWFRPVRDTMAVWEEVARGRGVRFWMDE
ncbi:hydroxylysine kinase-like isoform X2 [Babylonia areolata]|uniref:hydroxylysine kinase-like isoform X2 n=1 Tax=Babylonia areolata TaxID=304850 RepID=UPI003FD42604